MGRGGKAGPSSAGAAGQRGVAGRHAARRPPPARRAPAPCPGGRAAAARARSASAKQHAYHRRCRQRLLEGQSSATAGPDPTGRCPGAAARGRPSSNLARALACSPRSAANTPRLPSTTPRAVSSSAASRSRRLASRCTPAAARSPWTMGGAAQVIAQVGIEVLPVGHRDLAPHGARLFEQRLGLRQPFLASAHPRQQGEPVAQPAVVTGRTERLHGRFLGRRGLPEVADPHICSADPWSPLAHARLSPASPRRARSSAYQDWAS